VPLFARASRVPRAGVLLAIPSRVACGLLAGAWRIYGTRGPAFYGLRTTLVAYVLLALLRIPGPENLREQDPGDLGRIVGLDRMPEIKTLWRKLQRLAGLTEGNALWRIKSLIFNPPAPILPQFRQAPDQEYIIQLRLEDLD